uniref:Uncharacterized protein n=1 Tax=viral metagenome TaxID=1070528 RepID=A0A6M3MH56_9ZZZZ
MSEELLGMDEAGRMAMTFVSTWAAVKDPVVTEVKEVRIWKRISDDDESPDRSPVMAYQVSGRFGWALLGEDEGYNRFIFIVERESRRVRGFVIRGGAKLSGLDG